MSIELWVSIIAVLMAGAAAFFTYRSSHTASLPLLAIWLIGDSNKQFRYRIANKGNGPAIIESVAFYVDSKKMDVPMEHAIRAGFRELFLMSEVNNFIRVDRAISFTYGRPIGGNEEADMAHFSIDVDNFKLDHRKQSDIFSRMEIQVVYRDIFGQGRKTTFKRDSIQTEYSDPPIKMPTFQWAKRLAKQFKKY